MFALIVTGATWLAVALLSLLTTEALLGAVFTWNPLFGLALRAGAVNQFRHARLQDHLAATYRAADMNHFVSLIMARFGRH